jgi:SAM-dependent methyltransferase
MCHWESHDSACPAGVSDPCVEIEADLAAVGRQNLAGFPDVEVIEVSFETWQPPGGATFDLVFAATAWHWIDPAVKYRRAWELLRPGGHLAFWTAAHVFPAGGDPFSRDIQSVYDEIGEALLPGTRWQLAAVANGRNDWARAKAQRVCDRVAHER